MNEIVITGQIIFALPIKSGTSQNGTQWSRQTYGIQFGGGQYPNTLVFDVRKIQELALQVGETVTLHLNTRAHEYPQGSGKWFNSLEAWRAERQQPQQVQQMQQQFFQQPQQVQQPLIQPAPLPFAFQQPQQQPQAAPQPVQQYQQPQQVQPIQQPQQQAQQPQQGVLPF